MRDYFTFPPLRDGYARLKDTDGSVHDIPYGQLQKAFEVAPSAKVLARTQDEWISYLNDLSYSEAAWFLREYLTPSDLEFLEACGISWGDGVGTAAQLRKENRIVQVGGVPEGLMIQAFAPGSSDPETAK